MFDMPRKLLVVTRRWRFAFRGTNRARDPSFRAVGRRRADKKAFTIHIGPQRVLITLLGLRLAVSKSPSAQDRAAVCRQCRVTFMKTGSRRLLENVAPRGNEPITFQKTTRPVPLRAVVTSQAFAS